MKRKVSLLTLVSGIFVITAIALLVIARIDASTEKLEKQLEQVKLELLSREQKDSELIAELAKTDTKKYVMEKAREYGYVTPGQIIFKVDEALLND